MDAKSVTGQRDQAEINTLLSDLASLDQAGSFNEGLIVFTASAEKS
jgi:hypothetical protein